MPCTHSDIGNTSRVLSYITAKYVGDISGELSYITAMYVVLLYDIKEVLTVSCGDYEIHIIWSKYRFGSLKYDQQSKQMYYLYT